MGEIMGAARCSVLAVLRPVLTWSRYIFRYSESSGFCRVTDIASRGSIDVALASLTSAGKIRRIRRGLYDLPVVNPELGGELSPDIDEAARHCRSSQSMDNHS
jgi:hypothetical protein